jgi:hypothetical protein
MRLSCSMTFTATSHSPSRALYTRPAHMLTQWLHWGFGEHRSVTRPGDSQRGVGQQGSTKETQHSILSTGTGTMIMLMHTMESSCPAVQP